METNLELQKINLIKLIISLQDNEVLKEIENFISLKTDKESQIVHQTIEGKNLTGKEYRKHIYLIQNDIKAGNYINHNEIFKGIEDD